jgi:hypothetical protein
MPHSGFLFGIAGIEPRFRPNWRNGASRIGVESETLPETILVTFPELVSKLYPTQNKMSTVF